MSKPRIKRIKFLAITRELRDTKRTQNDIAADYEVSGSTVSRINSAGNWGNFLTGAVASKPVRSGRAPSPAQDVVSRVEQAKAAGLNPQLAEARLEKKFADGLREIEKRYELITHDLHARQDGLLSRMVDNEDISDRRSVVSVVSLFLSVVAVVLSIIALVN